MARTKGSKNRKTSTKPQNKRSSVVSAKPSGLAVGDKIPYPKPLGGTEQVVVEGIETKVEKISARDLTRPETVLYLSNGRWMRGTDYVESLNTESDENEQDSD